MVIDSSYYLNRIEINHELENETGLIFNNLFCDINGGNIVISGNLTSNNHGKTVVIGAYAMKYNDVSQISANAFVIKKTNTPFNLVFNKNDYSKIFLYANYINNENNNNVSKYQVSDDSVTFDVKNEHSVNYTKINDLNSNYDPSNQFNLVNKLLNSYTIEDDVYNVYGIKILGVGINDEFLEYDELNVDIELLFEKKIDHDLQLYVVFYDKNNNIVANDYNLLRVESNKKQCIETVEFYDVKFAKAEKFKIFVTED